MRAEDLLLLAVFTPGIASILILLLRNHPNLRESVTISASILSFLCIFNISKQVLEAPVEVTLFNIAPGIDFSFKADAFGTIFALTSSSLWILVSIYSVGYMRALKEHAQTRFYFFFAIALFSAFGIAFSKNLITFYVFYELLTICTYPLVAHEESEEALSAGRRYLAYLLPSGGALLAATMITYFLTGTTDFKAGGFIAGSEAMLKFLFVLFLLGFVKAAYMPLHSWLPTAMVAPTPVSALLHAVAVVKAGVFGIIRVVYYVYGAELMSELKLGAILAAVAGFTMIVANLLAIGEDNLKRRIAYSTINQLSFILLGTAMLNPLAFSGAAMHIPFHGYMKITLFLCAGAIAVISGKDRVSELDGLGKSLPLTFAAFAIGAIGMSGIPPVAGFLSKWYIAFGAINANNLMALAVVLLSSLLDAIYFFPIVRNAFFRESNERFRELSHLYNVYMILPLSITALFSVVLFLNPDVLNIFELVKKAAEELWGGRI
ncbi:NADH/Ubiquinone/plastoquinone (complex I) [Ferroglobus placidus DSM 10642]|uniref:NADH/Ubiquinone/plastoquinone (Complex I) n=1 Tax=Ferroglobus placidus (strain DSM 10642 / AEDII12DO) TaxID=589924 RepID=D3RWM3_FERPA|nr:monovalent cation/H+ antiporter subunit D family protein [Ferroglobus placidus]ADC64886.1 NADH/Ubiquinone/plastoquinone (complex I) [Ferroglobus placidus DSM 10642]